MAFKRLDPEDFLISADSITSTCWSNNAPTLGAFYTSSVQASSTAGTYYLNVYQTASALSSSAIQFAISYGNPQGSGSIFYNPLVEGVSPTKTVYGQFRNLIYGDENSGFVFGDVSGSDFWALSVERARYKEHLLPGSLNLTLSGSTTLPQIHLTDNSGVTAVDSYLDCGRVYQIVSGSNGVPYSASGYSASGSYGLFLPDIATIILNPLALSASAIVASSQSYNAPGLNTQTMFNAISGGAAFQVNSQETVTSDYVFVRARNAEFNYSENPSYISGSTGDLIFQEFIYQPQSYITTIGLYNDASELLAVAKLSKPLLKDFTKECLVRVKLDF
jgi:hypothetical protein